MRISVTKNGIQVGINGTEVKQFVKVAQLCRVLPPICGVAEVYPLLMRLVKQVDGDGSLDLDELAKATAQTE